MRGGQQVPILSAPESVTARSWRRYARRTDRRPGEGDGRAAHISNFTDAGSGRTGGGRRGGDVLPWGAGAVTKKVEAGPFDASARKALRAAGGDTNAFFRRTVTIRRGDRVAWDINGFHTVTFVPRGDLTPGLVIPDPSSPISGAQDAAGAPFWFNGQPRLAVNPLAAFRQGGTEFHADMLHNSGLPGGDGPPEPYRLQFKRAGTFRYLCLVHPEMCGTVRVKQRGSVPSAAQDRRQAKREQRILVLLRLGTPSPCCAAAPGRRRRSADAGVQPAGRLSK